MSKINVEAPGKMALMLPEIGKVLGPFKSHEGSNEARYIVVLPGMGRPTFPLPSVQQLIEYCVQYINENAARHRAEQRTLAQAKAGQEAPQGSQASEDDPYAGCYFSDQDNAVEPPAEKSTDENESEVNPNGGTLFVAAGGLSAIMYDGRFEQHLAPVFDPPQAIEYWASRNMPKKFQETVSSLQYHWQQIYHLFVGENDLSKEPIGGALPSVMHAYAANFPSASDDEVISASVAVICNALSSIIRVLQMWDDAFRQQRDGKYSELLYLTFTLEETFKLFANGNMITTPMAVGDVFMPRYSGAGPRTFPGAYGPLHAHLVEIPYSMRRVMTIVLPILLHEFWHDFSASVPNYRQQLPQAVSDAIDVHASEFNFRSDSAWIGNKQIPTIELVKQIFMQTLSESDADLAAALLTGPAYSYTLLTFMSAVRNMGQSLFSAKALLRSDSVYSVDPETGAIGLESHMPDYPRMYMLAAVLDLMGFSKEAKECRLLADQTIGEGKPEYIVWNNMNREDSRGNFIIKIPFEDLQQVMPVVANAIINSRLYCLGGRSMSDLVWWDEEKQGKVNRLVELIIAGQSKLPEEIGKVHPTYVAAAAITSYWMLCKRGMLPRLAANRVEGCTRKMLDALLKDAASQPK